MKNILITSIIIFGFILINSSCKKIDDVKKDKQYTFDIKIHDTIRITFIPSLEGYSTKWINRDKIVILDTIDYKLDCSLNNELGCKEIWQFVGKKVGVDSLIFKYTCSCDSDRNNEPEIYSVRVRD